MACTSQPLTLCKIYWKFLEPIHSYEDASFPAPGYLYISQCSFGPQCQPQNGIFWVISLKQFLLISWTITYTCLIPWQIQKITYSGCERHTLTLLSLYTVFSSLPWLSGMVSQLRMCSLFKQDVIKNCQCLFPIQYRESVSNTMM